MIAVTPTMSDLFYQRALRFERPFTLKDLTPGDIEHRRQLARVWLNELIARGELTRTLALGDTFYEWVNE